MTNPILPNVTAEQYEADRHPAVTVNRSLARRVFIDGAAYKLYGEDWSTPAQCEDAASLACVAITLGSFRLTPGSIDADLDTLADRIMWQMKLDGSRPLGCSLILEPA